MTFNTDFIQKALSKKTLTTASLFALGTLLVLSTNTEQVVAQVTEKVAVASETLELAYVSTLSSEYRLHGSEDNALHIRVAESKDHGQASVLLNNHEVMKFRSAFNGLSPSLRAKRTANRLYAFLSVQGDARLIKPDAKDNEVLIRIGDDVLARIDDLTAERSKNDAKHLALIWTNLTRKALGVHPIMRGAMPDSRSKLNREDYIDPASFKASGHNLTGIASWYGPGFHGRRAADGSRYNMYELTAAHKSLPFGTIVRVRNEKNGKTVVVRITDRGPYIDGRIIDLSKAAADAIGMPGITPVTVELMERNPNFKIPEPVIHPPSLKEMAMDQVAKTEPLEEKEPVKVITGERSPAMAIKTEQMVPTEAVEENNEAKVEADEVINVQAVEENLDEMDASKKQIQLPNSAPEESAPPEPVADPDPLTDSTLLPAKISSSDSE